MPSLGVIVILALATFRLARLVAIDTILLPLRERVYGFAWLDNAPPTAAPIPRAAWRTYLYDLVTCPHCLGVWFGVAVYCAWRWGGTVALGILAVIAVCGAQSALASFTTKADA